MNEFVERASRYIDGVLRGDIPACKWTIAACQRQRDDLARPLTEDWPYVFDEEEAARTCRFISLLPHIKGEWANQRLLITLEDWQCFILTTVFGWVHVQTRKRRFREVYEEVPRKNAKSTKSSGIALYMLCADGEMGAEIYSAASSKEQARIVFNDSKLMASRTPGLRDELGVAIMQHSINVEWSASIFKALASQGNALDGLNIHFAVLDELHAHESRKVYDVIDSGRGARQQPLLWVITTAGEKLASICYERRTHATKVLDKVFDEPTLFAIIYTIDAKDDPFDERVWAKANPNWGVSVMCDDMRAAARKAQAVPSALNNFLTKRLNVWVAGGAKWMDMRAWERCASGGLTWANIPAGAKVYAGLDLAQRRDFAALSVIWQDDDGIWHACTRLYYNQQGVETSNNAHLSGWIRDGHVHISEGALTDLDVIAEDLRTLCRDHDVQEIAFDPALSMYFAGKLIEEGLPLVEITQRALFFTPAAIQVLDMIVENRLRHDGNPVMTWMMSNVVMKESRYNELLQPTKDRAEDKIDGAISLLIAFVRALTYVQEADSGGFFAAPASR